MGLGSNLTMAPVRQGAKWALGAHRTPFETAQAGVTVRLFGGPLSPVVRIKAAGGVLAVISESFANFALLK